MMSVIIVLFLTALSAGADTQSAAKEEYQRTVEKYTVPDVTLLNQDGKKIKLKSILDPGKPVIIDFIYTTCTTICPVLSANFLNLQNRLGESAGTLQLRLDIDRSGTRQTGADEEVHEKVQGKKGVGFSHWKP